MELWAKTHIGRNNSTADRHVGEVREAGMEAGFLSICVKEGYCGDGVGGWSGEGMKVK